MGSTQDPFATNGTCYYAKGKKADSAYIPCGNAAFGPVPCCQVGDFCMSDNACFNPLYENVYLAGCTEGALYENTDACPRKSRLNDQQWVGLVRCKKSDDVTKKEEVWMGCRESDQPLNAPGDVCKCTDLNTDGVPYFKAGPVLDQLALLPASSGGKVLWDKGKGPSNTAVTATGAALSGISVTKVTPTAQSKYTLGAIAGTGVTSGTNTGGPAETSPAAAPAAEPSSGLSTGAKAGIGVGVAVGAIAIGAIIWLLFRLNRRLANHGAAPAAAAASSGEAGPHETKSMLPQEPPTPAPAYSQQSPYGAHADTVTPVVGAAAVAHHDPHKQQQHASYYAPQELDSTYAVAPVEMAAEPYQPQPTPHSGHLSSVSQMSQQHTGHSSYAATSPQQPQFVSPQNTGPGAGFGGYTPQPGQNPANPHASYHEMRG